MRDSTHFPQFTRPSQAPPRFEPLGNAELVEKQPSGVRLRGGRTLVEVTALAADLIRVGVFGDGQPPNYASEAIAKDDWRPDAVQIEEAAGEIRVVTSYTTAHISLAPLRIHFTDTSGRRFAEDAPDRGAGFLPLVAERPLIDPLGSPARVYKRHPETEHYFACGERTGGLDKTNSHQVFWNIDPPAHHTASLNNLYISIPLVLAIDQGQAWGLFLDSAYRGEFDLAAEDPDRSWFGADGGPLIYYVFAGPTPRQVLDRYTELTGRTPLPPRWALGNHQSRWGYRSAEEILALARAFRERDIPCDALYLDIDYMDGFRVFTWDRERFPDPVGLVKHLADQGFRVVTIVDPGVKVDEGSPVYESGRQADLYCKTFAGEPYHNVVWPGVCVFPDFTSSRAREWWGDQHRALTEPGIAGIWCDMNEPTVFVPTPMTLPPDVVHPGDGIARLHAQVHNLYGSLMARATREGLLRLRPDKRPFVITRSGYAGVQRHAMHWTGDNSSWWEHLWMSMPQLQNLGLSGLAWVGVDIGGFAGDCTGELLTRWVEMGIFQPYCRNHSAHGTHSQEPWAFGPRYEEHIRRMLQLRQRLIPYLYSLFDDANRTGAPILRPLLFDYPDDPDTYAADDEFLLGPALLVAPITRPGIEYRHVYLPRGAWFHYWSGERFEGPAHVLARAPLGQPALYVRANRAIPLWPVMNHVGERPADPLTLLLYPAPGEGSLTLYDDEGEGFGYEHGIFARREVTCRTDGENVQITIGQQAGSYPPARRLEIDIRTRGATMSDLTVNGQPQQDWAQREEGVVIPLAGSAEKQTVQFKLASTGDQRG